jgi:hypothetical protein
MIPKINSTSNEHEKQRFSARSGGNSEITLTRAENAKENDFLKVFRDVYSKSQKGKEK